MSRDDREQPRPAPLERTQSAAARACAKVRPPGPPLSSSANGGIKRPIRGQNRPNSTKLESIRPLRGFGRCLPPPPPHTKTGVRPTTQTAQAYPPCSTYYGPAFVRGPPGRRRRWAGFSRSEVKLPCVWWTERRPAREVGGPRGLTKRGGRRAPLGATRPPSWATARGLPHRARGARARKVERGRFDNNHQIAVSRPLLYVA